MRNDEPSDSSADRVLRLALLLRDSDSLTVTETAAHIGVSSPTAYRLLSTLRRHGFATQDDDRRYRSGPQLQHTPTPEGSLELLRTAVRPGLAAAQARLNETLNLWVLEGVSVRNVDGIESTQALAIRVNAWERVPAYISAAGKTLLARLGDEAVERMYANGLPPWPSTHVPTISALVEHLGDVRDRGYATNVEEVEAGVFGVAVALPVSPGAPLAALSCGVPGVRFSPERGRHLAAVLQSTAEEIGSQLTRG